MTYLLYRIEQPGSPSDGIPLGDYPDFDAALAARDGDAGLQLARGDSAVALLRVFTVGGDVTDVVQQVQT